MPTNVPGQAVPLTEAATENEAAKEATARGTRTQKQRGPPEDGIPSKTKVMVANLPYDLNEEKVCHYTSSRLQTETNTCYSSRNFSRITNPCPPRSLFVLFLAS